jgi:hypothetical protein
MEWKVYMKKHFHLNTSLGLQQFTFWVTEFDFLVLYSSILLKLKPQQYNTNLLYIKVKLSL